jgi:3-hydroxyisobutyrate dehydrogenase-like beta-hydroxyacid dehydrogenase
VRLGFVGLGAMGGAIVARLLDAGHEVTGWNRTREKAAPLVERGMAWGATPREVAAASEVVLSMVTDGKAVESVVRGDDGIAAGLGAGGVLVEMSTIAPAVSSALAAELAARGASMLDAPVSGSPVTLAQGQLSIMVGGDEAAFERVKPVLLDIGPKLTYVGGSGQALALKLAINLALVVHVTSFAEAVALAERAGVARETVVDAMLKSVVSSPVLGYRAPLILQGEDAAVFADVDLQQKDLLLALELARSLGAATPLTAAANELLNAARGAGLAHRDFVFVFEVYRRLAGAPA